MSDFLSSLFRTPNNNQQQIIPTTTNNNNQSKHNLSAFPFIAFQNTHSDWVFDVIELKDGTLLSCSRDKMIKQWTVQGECLRNFSGHSRDVNCLMEKDDSVLLSGSYDKLLNVWNKTTCKQIQILSTSNGIYCLLRLRNNLSFLCGFLDGSIHQKRMKNFETTHILSGGHSRCVWSMCELRSGNVVSASEDTTVKEWDMKTKKAIRTFTGH